jgi:phosphoenolpyruvate carboxykinase (GTP)
VPASQDPAIAPEWEDPAGVPISAILFGGRRASVVPLVTQSRDWAHGVFMGSIVASETTAAATGEVGNLRRDPFAMLPFCGYNMADYFGHWLSFAENHDEEKLPKIFYVNWFRKGDDGRWLWPGFGENSRVLEWVFNRLGEEADALDTPIGLVPTMDSLDVTGVNVTAADMTELLKVHVEEWRAEVPGIRAYYATFGDRLPAALHAQVDALEARLG